jgi:hypothetical protein
MRDTRRTALMVFAGAFALGVAGLLLVAALDERRLAFTLGVQPTQIVAVVQPGQTACQAPIDVPADARSVELPVGTFRAPGPQLEVLVRTAAGVAGRDTVPAGYPDSSTVSASPAGIESGRQVEVCVRNTGSRKVALYGGAPQAARTTALTVDGRARPADLTLVFERGERRSMLAALPDVFQRASLFHASWLRPWMLWALAALALIGIPLLLAGALVLGARG